MQDNIDKLVQQFHIISKKGWIKSCSGHNWGSIGLTFEKELNKRPDSFYFPDYCNIEIKCRSRFSRLPIFLFGIAFDGPTFPEINRIVENYGYSDVDFPDKKVIFEKIDCVDKKEMQNHYKLALEVDREEEKVFLCVYDVSGKLIDRKSFIYFSSIENHLKLKLSTLALIYASKKNIDGELYFRYYRIVIYALNSFDCFISLLEAGIIKAELISRISKSGKDKGKYKNKNVIFYIFKENIDKLFSCKYFYNYDNEALLRRIYKIK